MSWWEGMALLLSGPLCSLVCNLFKGKPVPLSLGIPIRVLAGVTGGTDAPGWCGMGRRRGTLVLSLPSGWGPTRQPSLPAGWAPGEGVLLHAYPRHARGTPCHLAVLQGGTEDRAQRGPGAGGGEGSSDPDPPCGWSHVSTVHAGAQGRVQNRGGGRASHDQEGTRLRPL